MSKIVSFPLHFTSECLYYCLAAISVCRPATLREVFHEFCQSLHANGQIASSHLAADSSAKYHPNI